MALDIGAANPYVGALKALGGGADGPTSATSSATTGPQSWHQEAWTVGTGSAKASSGLSLPWYAWAALAVVGAAFLLKR